MLTPGAFLYSQIAVLNYRCRGTAAIPEGGADWGEKRQRKPEYPADCKHLSSCGLLTPLRLQLGMELTLIPAARDLAEPLTITSWTQLEDRLIVRGPNFLFPPSPHKVKFLQRQQPTPNCNTTL